MYIIILVVVGIATFIGLFFLIKHSIFTHNLINQFKIRNVVVAGKKGSGKDLIFQKVINKRKSYYYSNISYGGRYKKISLKQVSVEPNTYRDFINEDITKIKRTLKEKCDIYISDGGIYLPSYMDATLYKLYPSMPIYYALSRHLYNSNIHVNVQNFERLWKALREQADYFVLCKKTIKLFGFFFTKVICYDKYQSAVQNLEPIKNRFMNKYSKAQTDLYSANNGEIIQGWIIQRKRKVKYDTRAFEKIVLKGKRKK